MPTPAERAWAAGFFDGEGCFTHAARDRRDGRIFYQTASIGQNERELLDKFCTIAGVGKVNGPYLTNSNSTYYTWTVRTKPRVRQVAKILWPFLGEIKRKKYLFERAQCVG